MSSRAKVFEPESVGDPDCGEGGGDDHKALAVEGGPLRGLIRVRSHHRYIIYYYNNDLVIEKGISNDSKNV